MVALTIRVHVITPIELWDMALRRGIVPPDLAKYLAWSVAASNADYVREVSELVLTHDRGSASTPPETAKQIAIGISHFLLTIKKIADFEVGGNAACAICIDAVMHHFLLVQLYAIARTHGLRPIVQEGEYKGVKYVIVAGSEAGLPEAIRAVEEEIETACRRARLCNK